MKKLRFFLDFDGTVAAKDVVDAVLERFAAPAWRAVEDEWTRGHIGSRECLARQIALVQTTPQDLNEFLGGIGVDAGFESFLRTARGFEMPVSITSDGFDFFIREILRRSVPDADLLENVPVYSNRLVWQEGRLVASFAEPDGCAHGCANCKSRVIQREKGRGDFVIYVGDGLSDRYAARESDLVFAKDKLLEFCRTNRIKHRAFSSFKEIEEWLLAFDRSRQAIESLHLG